MSTATISSAPLVAPYVYHIINLVISTAEDGSLFGTGYLAH